MLLDIAEEQCFFVEVSGCFFNEVVFVCLSKVLGSFYHVVGWDSLRH